jgi:DNA-binding HxlR family transcriptional regulator
MARFAGTSPPARVRTGGTVLSLLAGPLCVPVLRAHLDSPLQLPELHERIDGVTQTTLRGQVVNLRGIGALEREVLPEMPYKVVNHLTPTGRRILEVAESVEAWLARAPKGPIVLGSEPAKGPVRALIGGWSSTILHALAARPLSLTELDGVIPDISYPSLERRLSAMRAAHQVEGLPGRDGGRPYAVTEWARRAVGPLAAASRCECLHSMEAADPPTRIDIEAAFLLAIPLVVLSTGRSGSCLLAVDADSDNGVADFRLAGIHVEIEKGAVTTCVSRPEHEPETWAFGRSESWLDTALDGRHDRLRIGGKAPDLAEAVIAGIHAAL